MRNRLLIIAPIVAALALAGAALGVSAQEPVETADGSATAQSATGVIVRETDADGGVTYYLVPTEGEPIALSFGPAWFWGPRSPLDELVDQTVTLEGHLRGGMPDEHASEDALTEAQAEPAMKVRSANGRPLREKGKPPWAGGPKAVGEVHPGYVGWSEGQAEKAAEKAEKPATPPEAQTP